MLVSQHRFENLRQRLIDELRQITPEVFHNVRERFEHPVLLHGSRLGN